MKIVLASTYVPFIKGGGRFIVDWLEQKLLEYGHEVETFFLPFTDHPEKLLGQIAAFRLMDLSEAGDRLVAFRPPAYVLRHPHKILWFIHHIRAFYDLWGTEYAPPLTPARDALRQAITGIDNATLGEARTIFTNSRRVSDRLAEFNGVASTPLYPPILEPEQFVAGDYGDEIVVLNRVEPHKRQLLMVEAMTHVKTPVRLRLCGRSTWPVYAQMLRDAIAAGGLGGRVTFEDRWISEADKAAALKNALAIAYTPFDEDGIGYPCEEAAYARKAVIATTDSGAVLEFVTDGRNGLVVEPQPAAIAEAMDRLYLDRVLARRYGETNFARLGELNIDWSHVVDAIAA
jgi:glycosyltransferase involved in cell wall biosynthesis